MIHWKTRVVIIPTLVIIGGTVCCRHNLRTKLVSSQLSVFTGMCQMIWYYLLMWLSGFPFQPQWGHNDILNSCFHGPFLDARTQEDFPWHRFAWITNHITSYLAAAPCSVWAFIMGGMPTGRSFVPLYDDVMTQRRSRSALLALCKGKAKNPKLWSFAVRLNNCRTNNWGAGYLGRHCGVMKHSHVVLLKHRRSFGPR